MRAGPAAFGGRCRLIATAVALFGCTSSTELAGRVASASTAARLPAVSACWQQEFESAGYRGSWVATVDFTVSSGSSHIRGARVVSLEARDGAPEDHGPKLSQCLVEALEASQLPTIDDATGPGFSRSGDLVVHGYRLELVDTSSKGAASARQANVLIGPRGDRCQGLYTHDPPRDASTLDGEIARAEAHAAAIGDDPPALARELQKLYDLELELRDRLGLDMASPDLPAANRKRVGELHDRALLSATRTGARIGCTPH